MSFNAYLFISLLAATALLISMHPIAWALWGVLLLVTILRLAGLLIGLTR
jgi:hypothetical protein